MKGIKKTAHSYYRGIRGVHFLWHGAGADPEISYLGKVVNYYDVEDTMWQEFKEDMQIKGLPVYAGDDDAFTKYCQQRAADIKQLITDIWEGKKNSQIY